MQQFLSGRTVRMRAVLLSLAWMAAGMTNLTAGTACGDRLISRDQARQVGLERAWSAQVRLNRSRNSVGRAVLANDRLDVLTTAGIVQELNAETGETLWIASVGNPRYPNLGPAVSEQFVAFINGATLYVLDRTDGRPVRIRRVGGAPGAAPALTKDHAIVPLLSGRVVGFPLDKDVFTPWYYQSIGRAKVPPLATADSFAWSTDSGYLYLGGAENLNVRSRLETGSEIMAPAAHATTEDGKLVLVAAVSGEVFAIEEATGRNRWKYATGYTITRAPAAVGDQVYVTSDEPALHAIDAATGLGKWEALNVAQFAAASRNRVYGVDQLGALVVLDAASGAMIARVPTSGATKALVNDQSDRLYLVSDSGAVQCLREIGAKEPLYHLPRAAEPGAAEATGAEGNAAGEVPPADEARPPLEDRDNPFSDDFGGVPDEEAAEATEADEQPVDEAGVFGVDEENPFVFD